MKQPRPSSTNLLVTQHLPTDPEGVRKMARLDAMPRMRKLSRAVGRVVVDKEVLRQPDGQRMQRAVQPVDKRGHVVGRFSQAVSDDAVPE